MRSIPALVILIAMLLPATAAPPAVVDAPFPEAQNWDLSVIYPSEEAWQAAKQELASRIDRIGEWKGRLGESPETFLTAFETFAGMVKDLKRLAAYAGMNSDLDTREGGAMALRQETGLLATRLGEATAWIDPELLALPSGRLDGFFEQNSRLAPYRMYVDNVLRTRKHTLSDAEETIIAQAGLLASTPYSTYNVLSNAELPFPPLTLSTGETTDLSQAAYTRLRTLPNQDDRILVFQEFWKSFKTFERTFGANLYGQIKRDIFFARVRHYDSSLESALDKNAIPVEVYRTLVRETNANLETLHRYLRLRQRMLGLEELAYHDLYTPMVKGVEKSYPIATAQEVVVKALAPLGPDYGRQLREAFHGGWIDAPPKPGKRSGAYSNGSVYDLHPFVLLNHNDNYDSLSTLAHEMGHAMHSALANATQPYPTADYSIFVAEIASTFNEVLLNRYMMDQAENDEERLAILGSFLERLRVTFFRQAMFAEFELAIHEMVEKGEALTGEKLTEFYGEMLRRYYGHEEGICRIDPLYEVEWAYIPHFYYNFYVYQYSTGIVASSALARGVLEDGPENLERYLGFLRAGGSDYPFELLRRAGVDLSRPEPYQATMGLMNDVMDRIEAILDHQG